MSLDRMFTLEVVLVVVLVAAATVTALYIAVSNRRRNKGRGIVREDQAARRAWGAAVPEAPRREFYKSLGLETDEDMKVRLYPLKEYRDKFGGATATRGDEGDLVAALKAYRKLDGEWHEYYSPKKEAEILELGPEDYEVDERGRMLLLRGLPPGLPIEARDAL
jgi:hypothetical protein